MSHQQKQRHPRHTVAAVTVSSVYKVSAWNVLPTSRAAMREVKEEEEDVNPPPPPNVYTKYSSDSLTCPGSKTKSSAYTASSDSSLAAVAAAPSHS